MKKSAWKHSITMAICLMISLLAVGVTAGCSLLDGNSKNSSSDLGSIDSEISEEQVESSFEVEVSSSEEDVTSVEETSSESSESSEEPVKPVENPLKISEFTEPVVPYIDAVRNYLEAGAGAKVGNYYETVETQAAPVQVKWKYNVEGARKFVVEYATKVDFSDSLSIEVGASKRVADIYNLYKATKYYVRVTALNSKNEVLHTAESEFETTSLGPRFMYIDDVRNVRDLGGYETIDGKMLVQGIAYRGGALTAPPGNIHYSNEISESGKQYMSEVMGIKTEIDFRTASESGVTLEQGSVIPGATLTYITLNGYKDTFDYDDEYRAFFSMLADKNSYPLYMHCTGGADRTGSVSFLLHTMLGVSELECLQGYELTSFSTYGLRDTQDGGTYQKYFDGFMTKLNTYEGTTMQEKVQTWMLSIGVTQEQIDTIKGIFYGEIAIADEEAKDVKEIPIVRSAEKKMLNEMLEETAKGWAIQKKKD